MNNLGGCICDRCSTIIGPPFSVSPENGVFFLSKQKKTKMHFCSEKCKLVFLKGKRYWNRKVFLEDKNYKKLEHDSSKCL